MTAPRTLDGRRVLVTGAARGIGSAVAVALAEAGARVCLADVAPLDEAVAAAGGGCVGTAGDVADEADAVRMVGAAAAALGGLDALVNNAGVMIEGTLEGTMAAAFDRQIAVNLRGTFLMARAALPHLRAAGTEACPARLVNVASELALLGRAGASAYVASKCAVIGLARSWARELAPSILVNAVAPGPTDTELLGLATMPPELKAIELGNPLGRVARPAEIAGAVRWLLGPDATFVTGQTIGVTGGAAMF